MKGRARVVRRRAERGMVLIVMLLLLVMAGAVLLIDGISSAAGRRGDQDTRTTQALAAAKDALMAYALTDANRPGELPCPDIDRDGESALPEYSGNACVSRRGWLPWLTLDMIDPRDGSGSHLWYVVSDAFHANDTGPLNPDTPGGISVDGAASGDVVAVIIAPGEAVGGQVRPDAATTPDAASDVGAYLESANADADLANFVSAAGGDFNDRVAYITAGELLRATERRVLGEAAIALAQYRQTYGAYPPLSPFVDPFSGAGTLFDSVPGTRIGHLASIDATDVGETQDTGYTVSWTVGDAVVDPTLADDNDSHSIFQISPVDLAFMQNSAAAAAASSGTRTYPTLTAPSGGDPSCDWQGDVSIADCAGSFNAGSAGYTVTLIAFGSPFSGAAVSRRYSFDFSYSGTASVNALDGARVRDVSSGGTFQAFPPGGTSTVTVRDYVTVRPEIYAEQTLVINDGSTATVDVNGIYQESFVTGGFPGDLPAWFYAQQWDRFVLVEYAGNALPGESLAMAATPCTTGAQCVTLNVAGAAVRSDVLAVVTGAGRQVGAAPACQDRYGVAPTPPCVASAPAVGDYFEQLNANVVDRIADRRVLTAQFNDQIRVVEPAPLP